MRLIRLEEVNFSNDDHIFKTSPFSQIIAVIICFGLVALFTTLKIIDKIPTVPACFMGGIFGLGGLIVLKMGSRRGIKKEWKVCTKN